MKLQFSHKFGEPIESWKSLHMILRNLSTIVLTDLIKSPYSDTVQLMQKYTITVHEHFCRSLL